MDACPETGVQQDLELPRAAGASPEPSPHHGERRQFLGKPEGQRILVRLLAFSSSYSLRILWRTSSCFLHDAAFWFQSSACGSSLPCAPSHQHRDPYPVYAHLIHGSDEQGRSLSNHAAHGLERSMVQCLAAVDRGEGVLGEHMLMAGFVHLFPGDSRAQSQSTVQGSQREAIAMHASVGR